ncbi:MAG: site-specific DNA-methyltransferase, partial [Chloroflexi bacterium]|nr:site-specific DNA-methyltransferase [Chloroflexota bacterium]
YLFYYGKSQNILFKGDFRKRICTFCGQEIQPDWRQMSSPGLRKPPERTILGKKYLPPKGRHWTFKQKKIDLMEKEGRIRINAQIGYVDIEGNKIKGLPEYLQTMETPVDSNWTDLRGYAFASTFATRNAEELLARSIRVSTKNDDLVMDFFLGSGTTTAVAHKLGKKWMGVEMAEHFYTEALPRMKRIVSGDKSEISKKVDWQGGGFFKYYELEQYENTLRKVKYEDSDLFDSISQDPYDQYVFLRDLKMLGALEIDYQNNKVKVDLHKLYPNIDVPETMSNLLGKYIKKIKPNEVELETGEKLDLANLDYKLIKPLIWW